MTKLEIATIGKEFRTNYFTKYHRYVTKTYKYCGVIKTRQNLVMTDEGKAILTGTALNAKVFTCPCCGEKLSFNDLEFWGEDITEVVADKIPCSRCYEDMMGDDL